MSSLAQAAARGGASTIVFQFLRLIIGFGTMIVIARLLAPADFGLVAMVVAIVGFAEILRDFGFMNAAAQASSLTRRQRSNLFWLNTAIGLTVAVALVVCAPLIATFYGEERLQDLTLALAVVFVINGASVQFRAHLVRDLKITRVNVAETVAQLIGSAGAVVLAILGTGYWALFWQQLITATSALVLLILLSRWLPGLPGRAPMGSLLRYGAALTGQQSLNYLVRNVDTIAIGRVFGAVTLGYYDRAYQLLMIPIGQMNAPLTRVAVPTLARLWNSGGAFESYLHVAQKVAAFITVPVFALLAGLGGVGVVVVYGERWAFAGLLLQILAVGGIFRSLMQITYWAYLSSGRTGAMLRFDLIALPGVAACMLGGLMFGVEGVAAGHSLGYFLYWLAGLWWMTHKLELQFLPFLSTAGRSLCLAIPVAVVGYVVTMMVSPPVLALALGLLSASVIVGVLVLAVPAIRADYATVLRVARLALKRKRG